MSLINSWVFQETKFKADEFLTNTGNTYRLVSQRPYVSKKNPEDKGVALRLQIIKDTTDYGNDKTTGLKRDNNVFNSFDVTVLNNKDRLDIQKGEYLRLIDYIEEKSFVIGFEMILRFRDAEKVNVKTK